MMKLDDKQLLIYSGVFLDLHLQIQYAQLSGNGFFFYHPS